MNPQEKIDEIRKKLATAYKIEDAPIFSTALRLAQNKYETRSISGFTNIISTIVRQCEIFTKHVLHISNLCSFQSTLHRKSTDGTLWNSTEKVLAFVAQPISTNEYFFTSACYEVLEKINVRGVLCSLSLLLHDRIAEFSHPLLAEHPNKTVVLMLFIFLYYSTLLCHCSFSFQPRHNTDNKSPTFLLLCAYLLIDHAHVLENSSLRSAHLSVLICSATKYNKNLWISDTSTVPLTACIKLESYIQENARKEAFKIRAIFQTIYEIVLMITALRRDCIGPCFKEIIAHNLQYLTELTSHKYFQDKYGRNIADSSTNFLTKQQ